MFSATVTAEAEAEGLELVVTYETAELEVRETAVGTLEEGTVEMDAELDGADRIMSLAVREVGLGADLPNRLEVTLRNVMAGADALNLSAWQALRWRGSDGEVEPAEAGIALRLEPGAGHVIGGIAPPAAPLPVLVSPEVSRSQGPLFEATLGGQRLSFRRVAVAQHFPSVLGEFMVMSTPALLQAAARIPEAGLALNEVWAAGTLDPLPALEAAGFVPGAVAAAGPIIGALAQLPQSLAVGMNFAAAVGGVVLVVLGVAVGLYFAQRRREFEFASLRAMGAEPRQVSRVLLLEQGLLVVFAICVGAGLGFGILELVMPYISRSLGAAFPAPMLVVDWVSMGISLAAIVAATAVGLLAALRALLRSSVTSVLRGEAE